MTEEGKEGPRARKHDRQHSSKNMIYTSNRLRSLVMVVMLD